MSDQEKCPKCGAEERFTYPNSGTEFECLSFLSASGSFYQHKECLGNELKATATERDKYNRKFDGLLNLIHSFLDDLGVDKCEDFAYRVQVRMDALKIECDAQAKRIAELEGIILKDWRADCERFRDDPRNVGHSLPPNPLHAADAAGKDGE